MTAPVESTESKPGVSRKATRSYPLLAKVAAVFLRFTAGLSLSTGRRLGALVGFLAGFFRSGPRTVAEVNLRACFPELSSDQTRRLVKESLIEGAKTVMELGPLWHWSKERLAQLERGVDGEDLLHSAMSEGKGVLLLVPHLGNWEFINHFLMARYQFVALYREPRIQELDALLRRARERSGCVMVLATRVGVRRLYEALDRGDLVLVLPDQEPIKTSGVFAPFFGIPALTGTLVPRLLRRSGARPLFGFVLRDGPGFRVCFRAAPAGVLDTDMEVAAAALNRGVEECVLECPEQYQWTYKRFKTRPSGTSRPYSSQGGGLR
jgi:KDO2-lipid IV(A) lauroyltransferase